MACNRVDVFGHCPFPLAIICAYLSVQAQIHAQIDASVCFMQFGIIWEKINKNNKQHTHTQKQNKKKIKTKKTWF